MNSYQLQRLLTLHQCRQLFFLPLELVQVHPYLVQGNGCPLEREQNERLTQNECWSSYKGDFERTYCSDDKADIAYEYSFLYFNLLFSVFQYKHIFLKWRL